MNHLKLFLMYYFCCVNEIITVVKLSGFFRRMFDVSLDLSHSIADPLAAVSSSLMNVNNPQSTDVKTNEDKLEADKKGSSKKKESHTETKEENPVICTNEQEQRLNNKYERYLKVDS
ncbi:hypothetical protein RFI_33957 [Reticulomyxa filosa]|uniref:Uncharacterized protein n=1 Tax=Reticulomyxa filosa TaxID=46433 RepID=X6LRU4_RETFI|nr:hypothetical protein RFI_33957 [Reticulomyxa filosa]|eukprot:ETO03450.1 hypothetical protein RFI_33957 [Reticulomyxa filosa]